MRAKEVVRAVVGACAVYLAMAACSAHEQAGAAADHGAGQDAATGLDALTNPVPEAQAGPAGADVAVEKCDKPGPMSGTSATFYAEHAYPGKSVTDLARVTVVVHAAQPFPFAAGDYQDIVASPYVKSGAAAFPCGEGQSLTFVLP